MSPDIRLHIPEDNDSVSNHHFSQFLSSKQYKCDLASDNANPVELNFFGIIDLDLPLNVWVDFRVVILLKVNTEYQQNYNYLVLVEDDWVEGTYNRSESFEFGNNRVIN